MFNSHMIKKTIKSNWLIWFVMTIISVLLLGAVLFSFSDASLENLKTMLPITFFSSLGIWIPLIYMWSINNKLVAHEIEKGHMAYYLSTPLSRTTILMSKMVTFLSAIIISGLLHLILGYVFISTFKMNLDLGLWAALIFNWTALLIAISSIGWIASCYFNRGVLSIVVGMGVPFLFIIFDTVSGLENLNLEFLKYLSLLSLFNSGTILNGGLLNWLPQSIALIAIAAGLYTGGIMIFNRKDLPL